MIRESPQVQVIKPLLGEGYQVSIWDLIGSILKK